MKYLLCALAFSAAGLSLSAADLNSNNVRTLWFDECGRCHGDDGKANTPVGRKLHLRDYSSRKIQAEFTDEQAMDQIRHGKMKENKTMMPAFKGKLSEAEMAQLLSYLRSMAKNP